MARIWAGLAIVAVLSIGFARIWRQRQKLEESQRLAHEFLSRLQDYIRSGGRDTDTYTWLTHRANRMQASMGTAGISYGFRPPFANFMYREYPIVLNMLPELRQASEHTGLGISRMFDQYAATLQETLIRHQGILHDQLSAVGSQLINPIAWLREGTQFILLIPFRVLTSLGIGTSTALGRVSRSFVFRLIAAIVALAGFLASIVTILAGAGPAASIIERLVGP